MSFNNTLNTFKYFSYTYYDKFNQNIKQDVSMSFDLTDVPISYSYEQDDFFSETNESFNPFNMMHAFANSLNLFQDSGLIPPGFIYLDNNILIFERPPTHKLVNCYSTYLDQINTNTSIHTYYLPIPWQLYFVEFDPTSFRTFNVKMFFMQSSLQSFDQQLFLPPIPNFYVNGQLCRPFFSSMEDIERYPQTISGIIESAYDWIWSSNFNLDLTETISSIYFQKNPVQISRNITDRNYSEYRIPMNVIHETYSLWESFSLSEVSSFVWPNPAYGQTFNNDLENLDHHDLFTEWCEDNDIVIEDDSDYEHYYHSDSFQSSIPNPRKVTKTVKDVLSQTIKESSYNINPTSLESMLISFATSLNNS